jgi:archaemetzincin
MPAVPKFSLRTLSETLHDAALPASVSAKDQGSIGRMIECGRRLDNYFEAIIASSFAAYGTDGRSKGDRNTDDHIHSKGDVKGDEAPALLGGYPRMPRPRRGDWLAEHAEPGQSVTRFLSRSAQMAQPHASYNTIALVILGSDGFPPQDVVSLKMYVSSFFLLPVEVVGPLSVTDDEAVAEIRRRQHPDTGLQLFAGDCIQFAKKAILKNRDLSRRVVATMGITMVDLTKDHDWNFLYGLASPLDSSGCFSMCRFSPTFNEEKVPDAAAAARLILQRSCKVLTHELTHIFGVKHCVHFQCLMNGVNHVRELQQQSLLECPLCCRKLCLQLGWRDLGERYKKQALALTALGYQEEAAFINSVVLPVLAQNPATAANAAEPLVR